MSILLMGICVSDLSPKLVKTQQGVYRSPSIVQIRGIVQVLYIEGKTSTSGSLSGCLEEEAGGQNIKVVYRKAAFGCCRDLHS